MGMKGGRHCLMTYKEISITENVNHYDVIIMVRTETTQTRKTVLYSTNSILKTF